MEYNIILSFLLILLVILIIIYYRKIVVRTEYFENRVENVIMTTYFCRRKNPQNQILSNCNDINYIKPWYYSMKKLGLNGVIFHDGMSQEFIDKYQTNKIKFVFVDIGNYPYSLNDLRYFVYYDYINRNANLKNIFMTDGNDVTVVQSPFNKTNKIAVGIDGTDDGKYSYFESYGYSNMQLSQFNKNNNKYKFEPNHHKMYSAGILGGNRKQMLYFLKNMIKILSQMKDKKLNCNMVAFNYVIKYILNYNVISETPVCSQFKKYQNHRKDVWFIHK